MTSFHRCWLFAIILTSNAALAVGPDNSTLANDPDFRRAEEMIQQEKWAEAVPFLLRVEAEVKNNADVYNYLGVVYRKHRDFTTARQYYDRALAIDPEHRPTLAYLGEWFLETGNRAGAVEIFEKLKNLCLDCKETRALRDALLKAG
jgi:Flp pilus assembly protein TadD